jgi:hypothetical protein
MVNVKGQRCGYEGCESLKPCFGFVGARKGMYCSRHKEEGMVDLVNAKCPYQDCITSANPKYDGYCVQHFIQEHPDDPRTANVGKSGAEVEMETWLNKHPMVKFYTKTTIQCEDRQLFPDALVTLTNGHQVLIECDGPQHFGSVNWFGEPSDFRDQIERDLAKNRYAMDRGMSLLRISYAEYNRVEQELDDFFRELERNEYQQTFKATNAELYNQLKRDGQAMGI